MKFRNPFRNTIDKKAQIAALDEALDAAEKLHDPAERLLRLQDLKQECDVLSMSVTDRALLYTGATTVGGMAALCVGGFTANPLLLWGGFTLFVGSGAAQFAMEYEPGTIVDCLKKACSDALEKTTNAISMEEIARSPHYEAVMDRFPDLNQKFTRAALRERVLDVEPKLPLPPKPERGGAEGFRL